MPRFRYVVVDVFTDEPLAGNQLAVFTNATDIPEAQLQRLAKELNYSETTFVYSPAGDGHVRMRIFTPSSELPFAGHPTLGTAFVLGGPLQLVEIRIETARGTIPVQLEREGPRIVFGRMQQPLPTVEPFVRAGELEAVLGVESQLPVEVYDNGIAHIFVALGSAEEVAALEPDGQRLAEFGDVGINCFAGDGSRWKTRVFVPSLGVREDPATGSAAGPLATGASPSATRSRSRRAPRSGVPRRCTRGPTVRPTRSSGSRSAAAPSSSHAGSSCSDAARLRRRRFVLGQDDGLP